MNLKKIIVQKDLDEYINSSFDNSSFELPMKFSAPISLIWEITGECHSRCMYCSEDCQELLMNPDLKIK